MENLESIIEDLKLALATSALKIGHNLKYDLAVLKNHGLDVAGPFHDTYLAHALLEPAQRHTLDRLAETLLGYRAIKLADLAAKHAPAEETTEDLFAHAERKKKTAAKKPDLDLSRIPLKELSDYACEDADLTWQLHELLAPRLAESGFQAIARDIEFPLLPVLVAMEAEGIAIDESALAATGKDLQQAIDQLTLEIHRAAGREFNLNSPKQLGEILFGEMKLIEKPKKTKTGQFKTDEQTLQALSHAHPVIASILEYREASKLKSTYIDALPHHLEPHSGRVHTHLHQLAASTGRLASTDPNLQNIPVRSELGKKIRAAFVPRPGWTLLAADYSQIELRVMATLSGDPGMIQAFKNGEDIHAATALKIHGLGSSASEVTPDMRRAAKTVNFGIIYGISAFGLSQRLGLPRAEADDIITAYFQQYPGVKDYMDATIASAREQGHVETLSGRRRHLPDINSQNANIRGNAERAAINAPIQGTAADMIKIAMIRVHELLEKESARTKMILQVHDELLFDLHPEEESDLVPKIVHAMETALPLPHAIPAKVDTGTGPNWLEAH